MNGLKMQADFMQCLSQNFIDVDKYIKIISHVSSNQNDSF